MTWLVLVGLLVAVVVAAVLLWPKFLLWKLSREAYEKAEHLSGMLNPKYALSAAELQQHVPPWLHQPGEVVEFRGERYTRPTLLRAAILAQAAERVFVHYSAGGQDGGGDETAVYFQALGWFEEGQLRLVESPVQGKIGTTFVILKERGSKRFAVLHDAGEVLLAGS